MTEMYLGSTLYAVFVFFVFILKNSYSAIENVLGKNVLMCFFLSAKSPFRLQVLVFQTKERQETLEKNCKREK
jgi:hypothetical protein